MKKTNLMMLGALVAGSAAVWAVTAGSAVGLDGSARKVIEKQPLERIIPIGSVADVPADGYYTVPFTFGPTTQDQFNECEFPAAECGKQYTYSSTEHAFQANYTPATGMPCDYWAYLPGIQLTPGLYKFTVEYKTKNFKENFSISMGTAMLPEAQTIMLVQEENYENQSYVTAEVLFDVTEEGVYFIGLHHYSGINMYNVFIRNFTLDIVDTTKPTAPEITAYDFVDGVGSLTVAVPSTDLAGDALPANVDLHLLIDGTEVENSPFNVTPGQELNIPMTLQKGNHEFTAYVTAMIGGEEKTSEYFVETHRITKAVQVPAPVPAYFECDEDEFSLCTVLNCNDDTSTWKFEPNGYSNTPCIRYNYSSSKIADDYIVFPAIDCDETGIYTVNFNLATGSDTERMKVYWVSDPSLESLREATPILELIDFKYNSNWENITCKTPLTEAGEMYLVFYANSLSYKGSIYFRDVYIDHDDPLQIGQPSFGDVEFIGSNGTAEVILPATTLAGQPLGDVTISGTISEGENVYAEFTGTPGQALSIALNDIEIGKHVLTLKIEYTVNGNTYYSEPVTRNVQIFREPDFAYQIPFNMSLKGVDLVNDVMIYDVNNDDKTFTATNDGLKYGYHSTNNADDWVILLPMDVTNVTNPLDVTVTAKSGTSYAEKFSVWIGTAPTVESMVYEVIPETEIKVGVETQFTGQVVLPAPGKYRVGIHCTSDKDKLNLYLTNLKVEYGLDKSLFPLPVDDLTVTPDQTGELTATVNFTMPTLTNNGTEMAADEVLTATIACGENETTATGAPGAAISQEIEVPSNGNNIVTVTVANSEGVSDIAQTTVRCGLDTPVTPVFSSYRNNESGTGVELTWEPVTEGVNGGVINPDLLKYRIMQWDNNEQAWDFDNAIVTTETSCVFEGDPNADQKYVTLGIQAFQNSAAVSNAGRQQVVMGKPIEMDVTEDFAGENYNSGIVYAIATGTSSSNPSWYITDGQWDGLGDAYDPNNYMLQGSSYSAGAASLVLFPMISSEYVGSAEFTIEYWNGLNTAAIEACIGAYGTDREVIGTVPAYEYSETAGWKTMTFIIPETYMRLNWIQPCLHVTFDSSTGNKVLLNSYSVVATSVVGTREVIASDVNVAGIRGNILVGGAKGQNVIVSDLSGKVLFSETAEGPLTIPAQKGVYVVKAGEKTYKVAVK